MRYMSVQLRPTDGVGLHPLGEQLSAEPAIRREAVHHVEFLDDGTVLTLAEGSGDRERYEEIMSSSPTVRRYMVSGDDRWMAVSQFEPSEPIRWVLTWKQQADIVVETPIRFGSDGSLTLTVVGDESAFGTVFEAAEAVDSLDFEVVETGEYDPEAQPLVRSLTTRQEEVLATAVDVGYYRAPREATQADVARAIGLAPSTVGDHLRKIEERVFGAIVQ